MRYSTEEQFAKAYQAGETAGPYLLYGGESYLVEAWRKKITARFGGGFDSFNLQQLDGRRLDPDELYVAVEALPLMAAEKCVVVEDLETGRLSASDQEKLAEVLADPAPGCTLVITGKEQFDAKSAAGKKLIRLAEQAGSVVELGARSQGNLVTFLKSAAKKGGCELDTATAKYILETCETGMHSLSNEMAKLCALAGEGAISRAHVDAVAVRRTEARIFDLSKAILAGNPQRAMELLDDLFYLREAPVAVASVLAMSYADLYRARVARDSGVSQQEVVERFGYKGREFRVRSAFNSRLSVESLRRSLEELLDCDWKLKSAGGDGRVLVEQTVVRLLALQGGWSA